MNTSRSHRAGRRLAVLAATLALVAGACGSDDDATPDDGTESTVAGAESTVAGAEGSESGSDEEVTISYFTFSAAPDHLEDLDAIIAAFEAENPNINVEPQTASYDDYFTSLQTQIAGGTAPDTFELNYENFVTYARSGALLDLGAAGIDTARYYPLALEGFQDGGTQYGLPATFSDVVLIYNKTLFDAAGLDYPSQDWTWDDYLVAAEALTDADAGVYGGFQPVSFFEFYKSLAQAGGEFFDADGNAAFNSEAGVAAAEWLTSKPGTVMPTLAEIGGTPDFDTSLFQSDKLAMWHNGIWQFNGLNESGVDYDIVVEPGMEQTANAVFMNGVVASADTEHAEAAAKWIEFFTSSPTTVDTRLASSWELPAVNDEAAFASYLEVTPPENRQAVIDALDNIALPPVIERQAEMQEIVGQALERIVLDGADIQSTLDDAAAEVDALELNIVTATTTTQSTLDALVRRSIDVIADHQDDGGAYPASPTFPVYQFSWFRDGAFIADAMSRAGRPGSADRFFAWCAKIINDRAEMIDDLTTRARNGQPVGRDEHLPTRYTLSGEPTGEDWWDFQLDGYGTWMFMLAAHLERHQRTIDPAGGLAVAIGRCCDYLCEFWQQPCFDWWEEHVDGVHVSTLASIEAGLRASAHCGLLDDEQAERARTTSAAIVEHIEQHGVVDGHLVKTIRADDRVDASLIAAFVPFRTFDPHSDLAANTYRRIVDDLAPDGVHRYLGDTYFGGGRWVVLAGFVGAFEAVTERTDDARRRLVWICRQQTDTGLLPEQTTDHPLDARFVDEWTERWGPVATPLLWSHAMYITLADELERHAR